MADSPELKPGADESVETPENQDEKSVTMKQAELDKIVQKAMGRAAADVRKELADTKTQVTAMETELQTLRQKAADKSSSSSERKEAKGDADDLQRQMEEMKSASRALNQEFERMKQQMTAKEREAVDARQELQREKKNSFVNTILDSGDVDWVNKGVVKQLIDKNIKWDETKSQYVIVNDEGQEKLNTAYDPMTAQEFISDFASKNDYLVRSKAKPGFGSQESTGRPPAAGKFTVDQIFGKASSSKLANDLAMKNPKEYSRLKSEAKAKGIIA